jgi:D-glycero-D-manno-heptose 1,7-bisphosphate phosphatase
MRSGSHKAAFIDRDGVINVDRAYVYRIEDFEFIPGSIDALRNLRAAGYLLVVITNQSGIARGLYSESDYRLLEAHMRASLSSAGVVLDDVQFCPHLPDAAVAQYRSDCECRKPGSGMILNAARQLDIDLSRSILVGDRASDLQAGVAAGVGRCFLVRSGQAPMKSDTVLADGVFADLAQCVAELLRPSQHC